MVAGAGTDTFAHCGNGRKRRGACSHAVVPSQDFALEVQIRSTADNGTANSRTGIFAPAEISQGRGWPMVGIQCCGETGITSLFVAEIESMNFSYERTFWTKKFIDFHNASNAIE